jgi:hypothetical protein
MGPAVATTKNVGDIDGGAPWGLLPAGPMAATVALPMIVGADFVNVRPPCRGDAGARSPKPPWFLQGKT